MKTETLILLVAIAAAGALVYLATPRQTAEERAQAARLRSASDAIATGAADGWGIE